MIECTDLSLSYGKKTVLEQVSFTADSGTVTVILGKNGCGKSTLLRAVSGGIPHSGSLRIEGRDIRTYSFAERARRVGCMPQMLRSPEITVRELVSFGRQPYTGWSGILSASDRKIVEQVLEKTGLSGLADSYLHRISGGERQKAYFAMLLSQDPLNLLLDEPGSHLDPEYKATLCRFLREEREQGKTVLVVLHDLNDAIEIADQILVLHQGCLIFSGSASAFCDSGVPESVFGLRRYAGYEAGNPQSKCRYFFF